MAPKRSRYYLAVAKQEALLACDLYNEPRQPRSFELFVVHMETAWLNLFHAAPAELGGEEEGWDLAHLVDIHLPNSQDPIRRNLEFFIALRNRIEHRLTPRQLRALETVVSGKALAYLRDFDTYLVREFGERQSLGSSLRFPVFLASLERDAPVMVQESYRRVPVAVRKFIEAFDASTEEAVRIDPAYDFKVYLVPKSAGGPAADLAMEFVRLRRSLARTARDRASRHRLDSRSSRRGRKRRPAQALRSCRTRASSLAEIQPLLSHARVTLLQSAAERQERAPGCNRYALLFLRCRAPRLHLSEAWVARLEEALAHDPESVAAEWKAADQRATLGDRVA